MLNQSFESSKRSQGSALFMTLMVIVLLMGLAIAQSGLTQKSVAQSRFFLDRSELRNYAETGANIGVHAVTNAVGEYPGLIGTENWTSSDDVGADGQAGSGDEGEGDGLPTPGETNVLGQTVGPAGRNAWLVVYSEDVGGGVTRVVSTAYDGEHSVSVERQVKSDPITIPRVAAIWVNPDAALDFKGNKFSVNGGDYAADGTLTPNTPLYGLATDPGATPGDNSANVVAQIPSGAYDQVKGLGGSSSVPSVGEADSAVDVDSLANSVTANPTNVLAPGTYSTLSLGDYGASDIQTTYVNGDLHLSGKGTGAGILVVDGMLKVSGQFQWTGLVIVRGDITLTGGGAGVHVLGSMLVTESINAIDTSELTISGNADVYYSSEALDFVEQQVGSSGGAYESVYYGD